jgi:hypothetical protein
VGATVGATVAVGASVAAGAVVTAAGAVVAALLPAGWQPAKAVTNTRDAAIAIIVFFIFISLFLSFMTVGLEFCSNVPV